ncbi:MAG TPA: 5'-3' exonuclease H3TH domain-containing protein [Myxococcota bacterium]|jgi:5'-3' exonuclease
MTAATAVVYLIDAPVYVFRAWVTLPAMPAPDGTPTGAAYGYANTLLRFLREREPTHVAACFDHAITSFRNKLFPAYKQSRGTEVPADLEPQFAFCMEASRALGVATHEAVDYEADDVIATLAERAAKAGLHAEIVSADKDLTQLVREDGSARFHDLARETTLDADGVRAKFGVAPAQIPDYLALLGDKVDDLPGVPGFGTKSAAAALAAFGSLDAIPEDAAAWAGVPVRGAEKLAASWRAHRAQALRIRELATLVRDVPGFAARVEDTIWRGADRAAFAALCTRLGWGRIADRVPKWASD